jgi:hypothetical protein
MTDEAKAPPDGQPGPDGHHDTAADRQAVVDFVHERRAGAREAGVAPPVYPEDEQAVDLHVCMGLNSCRNQDKDRSAPMAGMGTCATSVHVCHGDGACRGRGACGYAGPEFEQAHPGEQACRWNGSCASPINRSRVFSAGPYKGKSVWRTARNLFEARMYEAGLAFGPSPGEGIPDAEVPSYELPSATD